MISKNLTDYVKVYKNHLPIDLCKLTIQSLKNASWEKHTFYKNHSDVSVSYENDLSVSFDNISEKEEINKQVWFAIDKYICKDFECFKKWFSGWNGYTSVRFNKYDKNTRMKLHCDHIQSMFDGERRGIPTLTILGALNDDYEGGDFLMFGDYKIEMPVGSVVVFPSNFMFPHEVKPVKSGIRYSYVSWSW